MKTTNKTQKTLAETVDQLQKDIARMEKKVAAMRRRIGAITRKHAKLQERIARLEAEGRIISLNRDSDIIVGIECWYLKSDSLNTDPDALTNYYYETTYNEQAGYGCSCESLSQNGCKHIRQLGATFAPVEPESNEDLQAYKQRREAIYQAEKRNQSPLNGRQAGFQLLRV